MKNREDLIAQAEAILQIGEKVLSTETRQGQTNPLVNEQQFHDFRISALSYLSRVFGEGSTSYQSFKTEVTHATGSRTKRGIGILTAAKRELQGDWLETTSGTISSDTLMDMIQLARMQLDQNNIGAAAIIAGTILEKHLRNICLARGVAVNNEIQGKVIPKKGLQLTGEAYKKKVYGRKENKEIISWLELSNTAATGIHDALKAAEVKKMLGGIVSLLRSIKY